MQAHIDEWLLLRSEVGASIPDSNVMPMFLQILPKDLQEQLEDDPTVKTFRDALDRVTAKCRRLNQARLTKLAQTKREDALRKTRSSPSLVHAWLLGGEKPAAAGRTAAAAAAQNCTAEGARGALPSRDDLPD